jgi:hypothetical protein
MTDEERFERALRDLQSSAAAFAFACRRLGSTCECVAIELREAIGEHRQHERSSEVADALIARAQR